MNPPYNAVKKCCNPDEVKNWKNDIKQDPTKGFHFSKAPKSKKSPITPGPGSYETNKSTLGNGAPKYSINKIDKETEFGTIIRRNKMGKILYRNSKKIWNKLCNLG